MASQVGGRAAGLLSWLAVALWLVAGGWVLVGLALESLTADPDGSRGLSTYGGALTGAVVAGSVGFALVVVAALAYRAPVGEPPRLAAGTVIAIGVVLIAASWLLPWRAWHDENQVINTDPAWDVFAAFGHVLVLAALALLAVGLFSAAERRLYWWLASAVGGLGLVVYWLSTPLFESSQTDTEAWAGPGVPTATIGFLAILAGAALPLLSAPRQPATSLTVHPRGPQNVPGRLGLIFGIIGILFGLWCFVIGVPLGVTAVVLGMRGRRLAASGLATNHGQAVAALILGGIALGASAYSLFRTFVP